MSSLLDRCRSPGHGGAIVARNLWAESFNRALGTTQANKGILDMSRSIQQLAGVCTALLLLGSTASIGSAQQSQTTPAPGPAVGDMAPDFTVVGATRYGVLRDSVRLSGFRGQTVVLAFFPKARTKG